VVVRLSYAPYVPTPKEVARKMLELAKVGAGDVVYDLGCGDGRILLMAVEEFGAERAVGYEIAREVYLEAERNVKSKGLEGRIKLYNKNLLEADISEASVITLYLSHTGNERLKPKLEHEARPSTRIVSHDFYFLNWPVQRRLSFDGHILYLYRRPARRRGGRSTLRF